MRLPLTFALAFACALPCAVVATPAPIRGEIVLDRTGRDWLSQQIEEPCVLPNPKDPSRLVMFFSGVSAADTSVAKLGKAWAAVADPFRWHQDEANPFFAPAAEGWDAGSIRLDCVLYVAEEDAYYVYYSGTRKKIQDRIGLAICPAGADGYAAITTANLRRHGAAPVLAPEPAAPFFESMASQAAVLREWDAAAARWNWFMYYSYRGRDGTLPGLRLATSADGKSWTRQFNSADPRGLGQIFVSTPDAYYEWHQVQKIGAAYVLAIEVGPARGARWRAGFAVSDRPDRGWRQLDLDTALQTGWAGLYDDRTLYHVATPALYRLGEKWLLFAQACAQPGSGNYIDGHWDLWAVACERPLPLGVGGAQLFLPGPPPVRPAPAPLVPSR